VKVEKLLENITYSLVQGSIEEEVTDIIYDSRKVVPGCAFVCIKGSKIDSHSLISEVVRKGVRVIFVEKTVYVNEDVTVIRTENSRRAMALVTATLFDYPSKKMCMIGITGTKGKTTTAFMIKEMLEKNNLKTGIIGTIGAFIGEKKIITHNTTPESYELVTIFSEMVKEGCTHCVMEVSSQGLKQKRVEGIQFDIGIFTNFSEDHIGPLEHATMDEYLYCKSLLFKQSKLGIINIDDSAHEELISNTNIEFLTYGKTKKADFYFGKPKFLMKTDRLGIAYNVNGKIKEHVELGMPGEFNIYNSLATLAVSYTLKLDIKKTLESLLDVSVRGRVEMVPISKDYHVIIDFAHNEEEVNSLFTMVKEYNAKRLICVYGSGGNRSKVRRYSIGELCGRVADLSILCADNPRDEEVEDINKDTIVGINRSNGKYIEIPDREKAIYYSLDHAQKGDLILYLGKGHEDYQEKNGIKTHFSEREVMEKYKNEKLK